MDKQTLRADLKRQRLGLSPKRQQAYSQKISVNLETAVTWSKVKSLHAYEPITFLAEADIRPFLKYMKNTYPQLIIYSSRFIGSKWLVINSRSGQVSHRRKFDAVLVPMLGFDNHYHRIGFGGGYYDQLLAGSQSSLKIGICFDIGHISKVPIDEHDISLDIIVTDKQIYR